MTIPAFEEFVKALDDCPDWKECFAWKPVTTLGGERVWLTKVYKRTRVTLESAPYTTTEYATLLDVLSGRFTIDNRIIMPLIRRIIPGLIAQDICGVQPMQGPVEDVFKLRIVNSPAVPKSTDFSSNQTP